MLPGFARGAVPFEATVVGTNPTALHRARVDQRVAGQRGVTGSGLELAAAAVPDR
jgi:hypothetical protein